MAGGVCPRVLDFTAFFESLKFQLCLFLHLPGMQDIEVSVRCV